MTLAQPRPTMNGILIVTLGLLTGVTPLATDMYLAAFPSMAKDLSTSASSIQLTLTSFMIGLAVGQFVIGPLSDQWGRKVPLLTGTIFCLLSSIVCALAPTIGVLIAARFIMGISGAAGVVIARSMITDLAQGARVAQLMNLMMIINGVAPVLAPTTGGLILAVASWRAVFWVLTAVLAALLLMVIFCVPESLSPDRRIRGGLAAVVKTVGTVATSRRYMGFTLAFVFSFGAMFAYISGSTFALQNILGLSEIQYAIAFAANSVGIMIASAIASRLLGRFTPRAIGTSGICVLLVLSLLYLLQAGIGLQLLPTLINLFLVASSMGFILGNLTTLALAEVPQASGAASALLGSLQFALAGLVSPLVSLAGESTAIPMGICMAVSSVLAALMLITTPWDESDRQLLVGKEH